MSTVVGLRLLEDVEGQRLSVSVMIVVSGLIALALALAVGRDRNRSVRLVLLGSALLGALGLALVTVPRVGWKPVVALLTPLVLAHLIDRQRSQEQRRSSLTPRSGALAVAPLLVGALIWFRTGRLDLMAIPFVVVVGWLIIAARHPTTALRTEHLADRMVSALGLGVAVLLVGLVAIPFLYLPALVERSIGWRARRQPFPLRSPPNWIERSFPIEERRRRARYPFVSTPTGLRRRRTFVGATTLSLMVLVSALVVFPSDSGHGGSLAVNEQHQLGVEFAVNYSELAVFEGVPFADAMQREQARYYPDMEGSFTNVSRGERDSRTAPDCDCTSKEVWLVGGSAAFGIGQRDDYTIASYLVELAEAAGISLTARNLGVPGATLADELEVVRARLATEKPQPDAVVVYDGFNDIVGRVASSAMHGVDPGVPNRMDVEDLLAYNESGRALDDVGGASEVGRIAAVAYLRTAEELRDLLDSRGIQSLFVFQPDAIGSERQLDGYEAITGVSPRDLDESDVAVALDASVARLAGVVNNMRDLFDDSDSQVFVGIVHTNEAGARMSAAAISATLFPMLEAARTADPGP